MEHFEDFMKLNYVKHENFNINIDLIRKSFIPYCECNNLNIDNLDNDKILIKLMNNKYPIMMIENIYYLIGYYTTIKQNYDVTINIRRLQPLDHDIYRHDEIIKNNLLNCLSKLEDDSDIIARSKIKFETEDFATDLDTLQKFVICFTEKYYVPSLEHTVSFKEIVYRVKEKVFDNKTIYDYISFEKNCFQILKKIDNFKFINIEGVDYLRCTSSENFLKINIQSIYIINKNNISKDHRDLIKKGISLILEKYEIQKDLISCINPDELHKIKI